MRTDFWFVCGLSILWSSLTVAQALPGNTNQPAGFRLTIELQDGSKIIGKCSDDNLQFRSDVLGEMKLPPGKIRSIECSAKTNSVQLTTANGDTVTGQLLTKVIHVEAAFGNVKLPVNMIQHIKVSPAGKSGQSRPGLVALWSGDGDGIDPVGRHNAIVPPDVTYAPARVGRGFSFDGRNHRVYVPDSPELNFGANQDFSIIAWILPLPPPPRLTSGIMSIVDKRYTPDSTHCQGYELHLVNGQLYLRVSDSSANNGTDWGPAGPDLRDGHLHHIAVTVARNSSIGGHLYVDGQVVLTFDPTEEAGDLSNTEPLRIGSHCDPNYFTFFHGIIDEIALYNRALSDSEIQEIYTTE